MRNELNEALAAVFGENNLNALQTALRAVITFIITVAAIRLGNKRLFGKGTAFDTVVAIMIGSVMSRAITGSGSGTMLAVWGAGLTLIGMHWLVSTLSFHNSWFGPLVKGHEVELVRDGHILDDKMQRTGTSRRDLKRAMRSNGHYPDFETIQMAHMERDGSISIVTKSSEPRIVDINVKDGVQTVRIALD